MALNKAFYDAVRARVFNGEMSQQQVDGLNALSAAWEKWGDGDERKLAYIMATALHETDRFSTMEEYASGEAYEGRRDLGNTLAGDGRRFKGRGFVQLTGRRNYYDWTKRLGIDLLADPSQVMDPALAARICVQGMMIGTFTSKALSDYINSQKCDFINARRVVNGVDRAQLIAGYAEAFLGALQASAAIPSPMPTAPPPTQKPALTPALASSDGASAVTWALLGATATVIAGLAAKAFGLF